MQNPGDPSINTSSPLSIASLQAMETSAMYSSSSENRLQAE